MKIKKLSVVWASVAICSGCFYQEEREREQFDRSVQHHIHQIVSYKHGYVKACEAKDKRQMSEFSEGFDRAMSSLMHQVSGLSTQKDKIDALETLWDLKKTMAINAASNSELAFKTASGTFNALAGEIILKSAPNATAATIGLIGHGSQIIDDGGADAVEKANKTE